MVSIKERTKDMSDSDFEAELLNGSSAYATEDGSKQTMIDLIRKKFGADDLVKIKNFTKEKIGWVYSDKKGTVIEQPNEFTRRVYQGDQKVRVINPGQSKVVPGWEAYVGLVRFYKSWVQSENSDKVNVMMNSPMSQKAFLDMAFMGVYDPNEIEEPEEDVKAEVEKDLGLSDGKAKS